jgi:hypothetical protein
MSNGMPKDAVETVTYDKEDLSAAITALIARSAWFSVTPLPEGRWEVAAKAEGHLPAVEKRGCRHLRGYWISKGARFRCYICGHQFQVSEVEDDAERRIEEWKK